MKSRILIIISVVIVFIVILILGVLTNVISISKNSISINPPGVSDLFACGDYCPGDESDYTVKVYTGVTTKEECDKKGGEFTSFTGWGETFYCKVK